MHYDPLNDCSAVGGSDTAVQRGGVRPQAKTPQQYGRPQCSAGVAADTLQ